MVKTTTVQKIWMGKTTTIQVFDHMTKNLDSSKISIPIFYQYDFEFWPGMNINFLNDKQNNSALLDIFIVKSLEIEILNNGTDTDSITDP